MRNRLKRKSLTERNARFGYFFVAPFIIGFFGFTLFPMIQSLVFSFQNITYNAEGYSTEFLGITHYNFLFVKDPAYRLLIVDSLKNMLLQVPLIVFFSFFAAILINQKFHGRLLVRAIFFLPVIIASSVLVGMDVNAIMAASSGGSGVSDVMEAGGGLSGLTQSLFVSMNLPASFTEYIINGVEGIAKIVSASGVQILLFLAGLQSVTPSQMEAAKMEGANSWESFWKIIVPIVSPIILVSTIYTIIDSFTSNENAIIKAVAGQYKDLQFGLGSAMAWVYILVVFVVVALVYGIFSKVVFYQNER